MAQLDLPYGNGSLPVSIADEFLGPVVEPRPFSAASDVDQLIQEAVQHPIGAAPITELVKRGQRVAIVVDDYTRKTPVARILPLILRLLEEQGVADRQIQIVAALGTHRPMTEAELRAKVGADIVSRYEVINTSCEEQDEMLFLGTSSNGIPAWVNRSVAEADLRIGIGMITPHSDTGFSGGSKIILPGVCSSRTVNAFHAAGAFLGETQLGKIDSPLRINLESFVADRIPLSFIVNVILNIKGEIVQCVAGDPVQAHRQGAAYARQSFGVPVDRRYEVVVANSYPYDVDFWQSTKGIFCGSLIVADGGVLIVLTAATEGNSNYPRFPGYIGQAFSALQKEIREGQLDDGNLKAEAVKLGLLRERVRLLLVSAGLDDADGEVMGLPMFPTVEAALEEALRAVPQSRRQGSVCVLPQAGVTLPLMSA